MARTTGIEWTDHTWNPFVGCSRVSPGCVNCYAVPTAARSQRFGVPQYQPAIEHDSKGRPQWTGVVTMAPKFEDRLASYGQAAQLIFVNSMSDFWHENATNEMRRAALDVMRKYPQHGFQVLTKRPENIAPALKELGPLPDNFWLGATVEDQPRVHERLSTLMFAPAKLRFLSVEPLLGPVDLSPYLRRHDSKGASLIHWVIVGGESGPDARPMKAEWVRALKNQCRDFRVPMFFKQWGSAFNNPLWAQTPPGGRPSTYVAERDPVGKGGSLLDGEEVKEMPRAWTRGVSPANASLPLG